MARITRRTFVAAPAPYVWKLAGDFAEWHPRLRIAPEGPESSAELVVEVLERDDEVMTLTYTMPEPPMPITDHRATILVEDAGHGSSYVTWSAEFSSDPAILQQLEDQIGDDVFSRALDKLACTAQDAQIGRR